MWDWIRHDVRAAVRLFVRRPGYGLMAAGTLAVGLGLNTIAFSAVNALLFRAARIARGDSIGWLYLGTRSQPYADASLPLFERVRRDARTLETVVAEGRMPLACDSGNGTDQIWALVVSPDYFSTVRVPLAIGRAWRLDETGNEGLGVLVSERFWQSHLGGSRDLASLVVRVNRQPAHVVGVVGDTFEDPGGVFAPDMLVPLSARDALGLPATFSAPSNRWLTIVGRPQPGVSADAVRQDVLPLVQHEVAAAGGTADEVRVLFAPIAGGNPSLASLRRVAAVGLTAVGIVLFMACFNVAGLLLARSVERERELAIRAAIGASRARLVSQMIVENGVLAFLGAIVAIVLARWSAWLLSAFSLPAPIPERLLFPTDWPVFAYAASLAAAAVVIPALGPVWRVVRRDTLSGLRGLGVAGSRRESAARRAFVVAQTAGSTLLLAAALVFARSFLNVLTRNTGFDVDHTVVLQIDPAQYGYSPDRSRRLLDELGERVRRLPSVRSAATADRLPLSLGPARLRTVSLDNRDCRVSRCPEIDTDAVDGDFFRALNVPLRAGRAFEPQDGAEAVIVNESAARPWPQANAVDRMFREGPERRPRRVVGVVPDIVQRSLSESPRPHMYRTMRDADLGGPLHLVVRTDARSSDLVAPLRNAVRDVDPDLPAQSVQTMRERMALPLWLPRTMAGFFTICGGVAVLLTTVGLFGVTYYLALQRTREFGVRLALGATRASLGGLVIGEAVRLATPGIGIVIGLAAAVGALAAARTLLYEVSVSSPGAYAIAAAAQWLMAVMASWVPAARASRIDPVEVLRSE